MLLKTVAVLDLVVVVIIVCCCCHRDRCRCSRRHCLPSLPLLLSLSLPLLLLSQLLPWTVGEAWVPVAIMLLTVVCYWCSGCRRCHRVAYRKEYPLFCFNLLYLNTSLASMIPYFNFSYGLWFLFVSFFSFDFSLCNWQRL